MGDSAPIPEGVRCAIGQNLVILRSESAGLTQDYLRWATRGRLWEGEVARMLNVGAVFDSLNCGDIPKMRIPVPPLAHQHRIVGVLGALDDKIDVNQRLADDAVALADAEYAALRSRRADWRSETFGDIANVFGGSTPSTKEPSYWGDGFAWATPSDITALSSPYLFSTARSITAEGRDAARLAVHPPGTILMTSRATIGAFAINQVPMATNQGFIVVRPNDDNMKWYLFHAMRESVEDMLSLANGSTFLELSRSNFKTLGVHVPPSDVRKRFDSMAGALHTRATAAAAESRSLAEFRDALLPKLLSGELRVGDAEGELEEAGV